MTTDRNIQAIYQDIIEQCWSKSFFFFFFLCNKKSKFSDFNEIFVSSLFFFSFFFFSSNFNIKAASNISGLLLLFFFFSFPKIIERLKHQDETKEPDHKPSFHGEQLNEHQENVKTIQIIFQVTIMQK